MGNGNDSIHTACGGVIYSLVRKTLNRKQHKMREANMLTIQFIWTCNARERVSIFQ